MRKRPMSLWKWALVTGGFLVIFMIGVHAMHAHRFQSHYDRMNGYAGCVTSMEGMGGHMTRIQVVPYGGREVMVTHHEAFIAPLLLTLFIGLLVVGGIGYWIYRRMKRNAEVIEPVTTYTGMNNYPIRNGDVLDEWENHIQKEEKRDGDF